MSSIEQLPLTGVRVLDFSTLLPGPLATLILAAAGAEVIKIERPGRGDEMRSYEPKFGEDSVNFGLLNRGKRSLAIDLKDPDSVTRLRPLIEEADVVIEQFRSGVMERLGLGYEALKAINPGLIYCSITGYGQDGPKAKKAGHDLNYIAETGLLNLGADERGKPVLPPALIADIAGGTYPAIMNILMALLQRATTGQGAYLDVAMCDNLFSFMYWAMGNGQAAGDWPVPGGELVTGGSPRYQVYQTQDQRYIAAAPIEQKFWDRFCDLIDLESSLRDDERDPKATQEAVAARIAAKSGDHWQACFQGEDVCCSLVSSLEEALNDEHFVYRGLFGQKLEDGSGQSMHALPLPLAGCFKAAGATDGYPALGEFNGEFKSMRS